MDVSGSQRTFIGDEWRASDIFFQSMLTRPQDRAMLVEVDARIVKLMEMTNSTSALHLALTQLGSSPAASAKTLLNDSVYLIAHNYLAKDQGRKAIILLTDGGDNGSRATLDQAIEQAQRANVPVYAILYSAWSGFTPLNLGLSSVNQSHADPGEALLKKIAAGTGGHVYTVERGMTLPKIYEAIENDLRTQYQKLVVQARSGFYVQP